MSDCLKGFKSLSESNESIYNENWDWQKEPDKLYSFYILLLLNLNLIKMIKFNHSMYIVQNITGDVKPKLRQDSLYNQWRPWMSMSCHDHVRHLAQLCTWPTPSFWHHIDHAKDRVLLIHRTPITCRRNYPLPQYISKFTCPLCLWKFFLFD